MEAAHLSSRTQCPHSLSLPAIPHHLDEMPPAKLVSKAPPVPLPRYLGGVRGFTPHRLKWGVLFIKRKVTHMMRSPLHGNMSVLSTQSFHRPCQCGHTDPQLRLRILPWHGTIDWGAQIPGFGHWELCQQAHCWWHTCHCWLCFWAHSFCGTEDVPGSFPKSSLFWV